MVEDSVGYTNLELLLNAEMQRQSLVAGKGEIKRWRDVINFDEDQPAWPIILQIWKASGLKLDEALGYPISDMEELFVKPEGGDDSDRVVVVKEEKEEEGKLRSPEPEESTEELREVTRGMSVEVPTKEWGWNWAKRTYGPEWKSKTRKGAVEGECEPIRKGKKLQPAHFVPTGKLQRIAETQK
eukprot:g1506.t1